MPGAECRPAWVLRAKVEIGFQVNTNWSIILIVAVLIGVVAGLCRRWIRRRILEDRRCYFVQCLAHERRFHVEWRENYDPDNNWNNFAHWRAYTLKRLKARRQAAPAQRKRPDHDTVTFAETVNIFQAFLRGESKPPRYYWRDFKPSLEREARRKKGRAGAK